MRMSDSLEIVYYGRGFTKGKNGGQKTMTGITIGRGEPVRAMLSAMAMLKVSEPGFWKEMDDAFMKLAFKHEVDNFAKKL